MNLSKIAAGLAVSLCVASNVALADEKDQASQPQHSDQPIVEKAYTKSLEEKTREKLKQLYVELDLEKKLNEIGGVGDENGPVADGIIKKLDFQGEDVKKFFDFIGYGSAIERLENTGKDPDKYHYYYPLKTLNDEINENKQRLDSSLEGIDSITTMIGKVSAEKASNKEVEKNTKSITEHKKLIEENKKAIELSRVEIEMHGKDIIENNNKIALNKKAIETMNQQLLSRLENLNKSLKSGLATQSALNGLFQPYNIGKMNVSAALGGYKSHNALAVGAGFRFNKNVAAKAGISSSFDGSALSYNMGVNYEF